MSGEAPLIAALLAAAALGGEGPAAADRAFAARAAEAGVSAAFLEVLLEGAALFRPHPVDGRVFMRADPDDGELGWEPRLEVVSAAGDLGFTIGPWTYRREGQVLGTGHYLSVWQRADAGAPWKLLADLGVPHAPLEPAPSYPVLALPAAPEAGAQEGDALEEALRAVEATIATGATAGDGAAALLDRAAGTLVAMRPGSAPAFGLEAAERLLGAGDPRSAMQLERVVISRSADLAVTWGSLRTLDEAGEAGEARGGWLRVWQRGQSGWRALAEVRLPPQ